MQAILVDRSTVNIRSRPPPAIEKCQSRAYYTRQRWGNSGTIGPGRLFLTRRYREAGIEPRTRPLSIFRRASAVRHRRSTRLRRHREAAWFSSWLYRFPQEGATMSEYTVDWAINVSVGVQTFFFPVFFSFPAISLYHIPLRRATSRAAPHAASRLSEPFDRCLSG